LLLGALVPSLISACAGALALVLSGPEANAFLPTWVTWFSGSLIGSVSVLPLALALWLLGGMRADAALRQTRTLGFVMLCIAVTLLAATTLPHPFGVMVLPLVLLAARTDFLATALATALTAMILGGLIGAGVLVEPPSSTWWGPGLFYLSVLATLLPGLFLASSVQGRAAVMKQLSASEQRFRTLYTNTPTMMFSIDHRGCITSVSSLWLSMLGYSEQEVLGRPSVDFLTPESARRAREEVIPQARLTGRCDNVPYQVVTRDGQILDVLLSAVWEYDDQGQPLHSLGVLQDVTERNRLAARSHFAEHDPLTGLPNRVLLQDRLERSCLHHARHGGSFALGFVDLDNFKGINDTLGHDAGDLLLREVAQRLQSSLRASDTVCRLGGDEFVLLFATIDDAQELMSLANKVLAHVAQPCQLSSDPEAPLVTVSGSMGVAIFPDHGHDPSTLMRHADQTMYRAKHSGRNRCELFKPLD
jgi:diguanylate cyclase (GGDEF)-like protein/PAS domain S-box-containing protein